MVARSAQYRQAETPVPLIRVVLGSRRACRLLPLTACDPIVTIAGANFPSWLFCMIVGAILAAIVRPLLVLVGLEPIFYPSLIAMLAMIVWVTFFNRGNGRWRQAARSLPAQSQETLSPPRSNLAQVWLAGFAARGRAGTPPNLSSPPLSVCRPVPG